MIETFSFATAGSIRFGRGSAQSVDVVVSEVAQSVLLVTGSTNERARWLGDKLEARGICLTWFSVPKEPDLELIEQGLTLVKGCNAVVAIGGGSTIDVGKALSALATTRRPIVDHLEVVGRGLPLDHSPLPFFALPTTAGTGSEVTRNSVITVPAHRRKVSLRDPRMLPSVAVVDPALTDNSPKSVTLCSGLDAVTQVIEPFLSTRSNPLTDALCRDAIPRGLKALVQLMEEESPSARDDLAWTSLSGGLALANAGLGAVHGLAGPFGGVTGASHGAICGALLPGVLRANAKRRSGPRMDDVATWICEALNVTATPSMEAATDALRDWSRGQGLPGLRELGGTDQIFAEVAAQAEQSSSMAANPVKLSPGELYDVLVSAA